MILMTIMTIISMIIMIIMTIIIRYDNSPTLNWWQKGSQCDSVVGAQDSATLPPNVDKYYYYYIVIIIVTLLSLLLLLLSLL